MMTTMDILKFAIAVLNGAGATALAISDLDPAFKTFWVIVVAGCGTGQLFLNRVGHDSDASKARRKLTAKKDAEDFTPEQRAILRQAAAQRQAEIEKEKKNA